MQGSDIPGTLTLAFSSGSLITVNGAIGWRVTALRVCAFCREPAITIFFCGADPTEYELGGASNYLLKLASAPTTFAYGSNVSGNAASIQLLDALNAFLVSLEATVPAGSVTVSLLTPSVPILS